LNRSSINWKRATLPSKIRSNSSKGVGLSAACKQELDAAEGKVQMLVKQRDGTLKAEPFLTEKPF